MQNMQLSEDFNENGSKYKYCCCYCNVVTGVKIFLALYIIGSIFGMFGCDSVVTAGVLFGVLVIVAWCTIYALIKEKPALLWVFIIVIMISVVLCLVMLLTISYFFFFNKERARQHIENYVAREGKDLSEDQIEKVMPTVYAIYVVAIFVQLAYNGWMLRVLFGCKNHFENKSKAKVMYSTYAAPPPNAELPNYGEVESQPNAKC